MFVVQDFWYVLDHYYWNVQRDCESGNGQIVKVSDILPSGVVVEIRMALTRRPGDEELRATQPRSQPWIDDLRCVIERSMLSTPVHLEIDEEADVVTHDQATIKIPLVDLQRLLIQIDRCKRVRFQSSGKRRLGGTESEPTCSRE